MFFKFPFDLNKWFEEIVKFKFFFLEVVTSSRGHCTTRNVSKRIVSLRKNSSTRRFPVRRFSRYPRIHSSVQKLYLRKELSNDVLGSSVSPLKADIFQKES